LARERFTPLIVPANAVARPSLAGVNLLTPDLDHDVVRRGVDQRA